MGRETSGSCIKKNRQIKNADQKDGSKRPLGIKFDSVLQTLSAAVKSRDLRLRFGVAGKMEKCECQRTFLGHLEGIGRDVWGGAGGGPWPFISLVAQVVTQKALSQFRTAMSAQMLLLSRLAMS